MSRAEDQSPKTDVSWAVEKTLKTAKSSEMKQKGYFKPVQCIRIRTTTKG